MRITIGDKTRECMSVLGINEYPFSSSILKKCFRSKITAVHPDKNKNDHKATDKTKNVIMAYNHLKNLAIDAKTLSEEDKQHRFEQFEKDNQDLFTLWKTCPRCNGSGTIKMYKHIKGHERNPDGCIMCNHTGIQSIKIICRACHGSGKYRQKRGKIVDCYRCNGSGRVTVDRICPYCSDGITTVIVDCPECNGIGKIIYEPFNPVIKKAAVML